MLFELHIWRVNKTLIISQIFIHVPQLVKSMNHLMWTLGYFFGFNHLKIVHLSHFWLALLSLQYITCFWVFFYKNHLIIFFSQLFVICEICVSSCSVPAFHFIFSTIPNNRFPIRYPYWKRTISNRNRLLSGQPYWKLFIAMAAKSCTCTKALKLVNEYLKSIFPRRNLNAHSGNEIAKLSSKSHPRLLKN